MGLVGDLWTLLTTLPPYIYTLIGVLLLPPAIHLLNDHKHKVKVTVNE